MIFIQLILAHLLGDFILQPSAWVTDKDNYKLKSSFLYFHVFIHTIVILILLWGVRLWWIALQVGISYFVIDVSKLIFQNNKTKKQWFFIDQAPHVVIICGISLCFNEFNFEFLKNQNFLMMIMAALLLTMLASVFIKIVVSSTIAVTEQEGSIQAKSLSNTRVIHYCFKRNFNYIISN